MKIKALLLVRIFVQLHCSKKWQDLANYFIN